MGSKAWHCKTTHWSNICKSGNGAVSIGKRGWNQKVDESSKNHKRSVYVATRIAGCK